MRYLGSPGKLATFTPYVSQSCPRKKGPRVQRAAHTHTYHSTNSIIKYGGNGKCRSQCTCYPLAPATSRAYKYCESICQVPAISVSKRNQSISLTISGASLGETIATSTASLSLPQLYKYIVLRTSATLRPYAPRPKEHKRQPEYLGTKGIL
jgi:hypothetical protein